MPLECLQYSCLGATVFSSATEKFLFSLDKCELSLAKNGLLQLPAYE